MQSDGSAFGCGVFVDDLDHAYKRSRTVGHRGRSAQDLNTIKVIQIQVRQSRIEGASPRHTIDHEQKGVKLFETPKIRYGTGWSGIPAGCNFNSHGSSHRGAQITSATSPEFIAGNYLNGRRDNFWVLGQSSHRHFHALFHRRNFFRRG